MEIRCYGGYKIIERTHEVGGVEYEVHMMYEGGYELVETFSRLRDAKALCYKLNMLN